MTVFAAIFRLIGLPGTIILLGLVYYEGLPGFARIPFLTSIPIIGDLTTGRVHSYAADQVSKAEAKCTAEKDRMVSVAEYAAVAAQLTEERRQRELASQITEDARKRAEAAVRARDKAHADLEARIAADTAGGCGWTPEDDQWRNTR